MKLGAFLEYFLKKKQSPHNYHWLDDTNLRLYLSQMPLIFSSETVRDERHESVEDASNLEVEGSPMSIAIPELIKKLNLQSEIDKINLWMNVDSATTNYHYDSYHNILCIVDGSKEVRLVAPSNLHRMDLYPVYSEANNHSKLFPPSDQPSIDVDSLSALEAIEYMTDIKAGDMLFIPEGWIHGVVSARCTAAVNLWFHSVLHNFIISKEFSHMLPYVFRSSAQKLIENQVQQYRHSIRQNQCQSYSYEDFESKCFDYHECHIRQEIENAKKRRLHDLGSKIEIESRLFSPSGSMFDIWPKFASKVSLICDVA